MRTYSNIGTGLALLLAHLTYPTRCLARSVGNEREYELIRDRKANRFAENAYSVAGLNLHASHAEPPEGPHIAVFIHAITEYVIRGKLIAHSS